MAIIAAQMSGHCRFPQTAHPELSHDRCQRNGGGNTARPSKEFQPCPCPCHYAELERYECGNCGRDIVEAYWTDDDGEPIYVHLDVSGNMIGEEC